MVPSICAQPQGSKKPRVRGTLSEDNRNDHEHLHLCPDGYTVTMDDSAPVSFAVSCVPRTGTIKVTTVTSGRDLDADGYLVSFGDINFSVEPTGARTTTRRSM